MTVPITIEGGLAGELVQLQGDQLVLVSPRAFAPGAPVRFEVALAGGTVVVQAKSHGSKRDDAGNFTVRGRTIGLRREDRDALVARVRA